MSAPQERGFFGSLNTIIKLVESDCDQKWDVLVETAIPAAGEALYILLVPSPSEIIENYLQPRPLRSDGKRTRRGHGGRQVSRYGAARWWQRLTFPDIDNVIAQRLPGRGFFEGRNAGSLERWVWTGIDILDRGLFYWMLLDIADDFTNLWASGIIESEQCKSTVNASFSGTSETEPGNISIPPWSDPDGLTVINNQQWLVQDNGTLSRPSVPPSPVKGTGAWTMNASFNREGEWTTTVQAEVKLTDPAGNETLIKGDPQTYSSDNPNVAVGLIFEFEAVEKISMAMVVLDGDTIAAEKRFDEVVVFAETI